MLLATVADQQVVAATVATISWQPTDSDGEPDDPGAAVTVGVVDSAGAEVLATLTATDGDEAEPRTAELTVAHTSSIDYLTATWTADGVVVATTVIEVVGRPLITKAEFELREPKANASDEQFLIARREVDDLFRSAMHRSWTPRFAIERRSDPHGDRLRLTFPDLREVRWANHISTDGTVTAITGATDIAPSSAGLAQLSSCWPTWGDIEIGYVHGADTPPGDVRGAAAKMIRHTIGGGTSSIPDRATIYTDAQGGVTQLATPGLGPFITGIPEVDVVLTARAWKAAMVG